MGSIKNKLSLSRILQCSMLAFLLMCTGVKLKAQYDTIAAPPPQELIEDNTDETDSYTEEEEYSNFIDKTAYDGVKFGDRRMPGVNLKELEDDEDFWYANAEVKRQKRGVTYIPRRNGSSVDPDEAERNRKQIERNGNGRPSNGSTGEDRDIEIPEYRPPRKKMSSEPWFQALMWIVIIGGFVGAVVWYLVGNNVGLFRKKSKAVDTGTDPDDAEMPEDIFAIQYQKEIDKAAANGDYRLAIRLMYLRLLKNLSERNVIRYKQDKTNFDYLVEIQPTNYYNEFFKVTRHYEYSWYGKFPVSSEAYTVIKASFDNFLK